MIKYRSITQLFEDLVPFFSKSQIEFLQLVDSVLEGIVWKSSRQSNKGNRDGDVSEVESKVEAMLKNLGTIVKRLKEGKTDKKRFIEMYPKWRKVRKEGTQKLKEIAVYLNSVRFKCNMAKLAGYSTSCLGGALCLASAIAIPFTMGLTTPLAIAGGTLTVTGCGATLGTSVTEVALLKSSVDEAQEIIKEDEKCFKDLTGWLKHAAELEEALAEVLTIDIIKDVVEDVKDFVKKAIGLPKDIIQRPFIEKTLNIIIKNLSVTLTSAVSVVTSVMAVSVLIGIFMLLINDRAHIGFEWKLLTMRSVTGFCAFTDDCGDILRITNLFTSNTSLAENAAKAITRGAISVVGVALDVLGIVLTSNDICSGSLSPEAEKISKAVQELEKEAKTIDEVYDNLRM